MAAAGGIHAPDSLLTGTAALLVYSAGQEAVARKLGHGLDEVRLWTMRAVSPGELETAEAG